MSVRTAAPTVLEPAPESTAGEAAGTGVDAPAELARPRLTAREIEILLAWLRADTKEEAASELFISGATVSTHLARIRAKYAALGRPAPTKTQLFVRAAQDELLDFHSW